MKPSYIVFSDVDETLIRTKSMLDFARFYFAERSGSDPSAATARARLSELSALRAQGVPRIELNRAYYRIYAGQPVDWVCEAGRQWFELRARTNDLFVADTCVALQRHRAEGAEIVLVSGSFSPPPRPLPTG
jgi:phosphoserine phosphatase